MLIGTAGHIDHGKTALVRALTGVDADRLPQEKARGITLDLGYAYTPLVDGKVLGFVDVPGHERLVHNMLAGATGIDFVVLAVAADDGPMPQTREHLQILDLLGLTNGAVAITKIDSVRPQRVAAVAADIQALLRRTGLANAPIFPVSSRTGEGLGKLRSYLFAMAEATPPRAVHGYFRLAIDRCFVLKGTGTIVTGTAFSGRIAVGEELILSPPGRAVRVRGIHTQDRPAQQGHSGQRCALNLAGPGFQQSEVRRGQWALEAAVHAPTQRMDVELRLLKAEPRALAHWTSAHVHLGATNVTGRVALLEVQRLEPGDRALAQIVLDAPIGALAGDRLVLRDQAASRTIGGGVVLDPFAPARGRRRPARLTLLTAWAKLDSRAALRGALAACGSGVNLQRFSQAWNLRPEEMEQVCSGLPMMRRVRQPGAVLGFADAAWRGLRATALSRLEQEHARAPAMVGISRERWRRMTNPALAAGVFDALVQELLAAGVLRQTRCWLHHADHQVRLTAEEAQLWARVQPLLEEVPFDPPRVRDLAHALRIEEDCVRQLLKHVAQLGEVYPIAHDHYFTSRAVNELAQIVASLNRNGDAARAAVFRDRIGTGRKLAIQILEFFDRIGYTRRVKDSHILSQPQLFAQHPESTRMRVRR